MKTKFEIAIKNLSHKALEFYFKLNIYDQREVMLMVNNNSSIYDAIMVVVVRKELKQKGLLNEAKKTA